jgi:hypothetical protein
VSLHCLVELIGNLPTPLFRPPKYASEKICDERKHCVFCGRKLLMTPRFAPGFIVFGPVHPSPPFYLL